LKAAETPTSAAAGTTEQLARRYNLEPGRGGSGAGVNKIPISRYGGAVAAGPEAAVAAKRVSQYTQESKFVNGRTFYLNGSQWVDSQVQKLSNANHVRIQFNSDEYFDLMAKQPKALAWLAIGKNVQFALGDTIYEIYE
jgi:hypothetical protein